MIRALFDGRKTQTRRACKLPPAPNNLGHWEPFVFGGAGCHDSKGRPISRQMTISHSRTGAVIGCPYGNPGDLLIVKEATYMWCERRPNGITPTGRQKWHYVPMQSAPVHYTEDGKKPTTSITSPDTGNQWMWRSKVAPFMPRRASRLALRITAVRVQRLQDISEADANEEGVESSGLARRLGIGYCNDSIRQFTRVWEAINGPGSWDANPWVWVLTFEVIKSNIDSIAAPEQPA